MEKCEINSSEVKRVRSVQKKADVEDAIIKVGDTKGPFNEVPNLQIERDPDYPIRVTLQFYKATDSGNVDSDVFEAISNQLQEARKNASFAGSLVVSGFTVRPTEAKNNPPIITPVNPIITIPPWWNVFWLTYGPSYGHLSESLAKDIIFQNSKFRTSGLTDTIKQEVMKILDSTKPPVINIYPDVVTR